MSSMTQEQIDKRNKQIAERLTENFGAAILSNIKTDYARSDLDKITKDLRSAQEQGLVFDTSRGAEILIFLTPDDVMSEFKNGGHFSSNYTLRTPQEALDMIADADIESAEHFSTFPEDIQKERQYVYDQDQDRLHEIHTRIKAYADSYQDKTAPQMNAPQ